MVGLRMHPNLLRFLLLLQFTSLILLQFTSLILLHFTSLILLVLCCAPAVVLLPLLLPTPRPSSTSSKAQVYFHVDHKGS